MKKRPSPPSRQAKPSGTPNASRSASGRAGGNGSERRLAAELRALRGEVERTAGYIRDVLQRIDQLAHAVGDLQTQMAELQASLSEGEVEYGPVRDDNSEIGEGHA